MLEVSNLTYRYPKAQQPALENASLSLAPGQIGVVVGAKGSGKSTLVRLVAGLLSGFQGQIRFQAGALNPTDLDFYRYLGVVLEDSGLFGRLSLLENLQYFQGFYPTPGLNLLALLGRLGLAKEANSPAHQLSPGMTRLAAVARALVHDPLLLLLDDPGLHLDQEQTGLLFELLSQERSQGKTILLTSHKLEEAKALADRVGFLDAGRQKAWESPESLMNRLGQRQLEVKVLDQDQVVARQFPLEGLGQNEAFLALLDHPRLVSVHSAEADLAQVFQKTTGKELP